MDVWSNDFSRFPKYVRYDVYTMASIHCFPSRLSVEPEHSNFITKSEPSLKDGLRLGVNERDHPGTDDVGDGIQRDPRRIPFASYMSDATESMTGSLAAFYDEDDVPLRDDGVSLKAGDGDGTLAEERASKNERIRAWITDTELEGTISGQLREKGWEVCDERLGSW